jgi:hypothetical protein
LLSQHLPSLQPTAKFPSSYVISLYLNNKADFFRLVMLVATQLLLEFKAALFQVQVPTPRPRSIPQSSAQPRLLPMAWVVQKARAKTLWLACLLSLLNLGLLFHKLAAVGEPFPELSMSLQLMELGHLPVCVSVQCSGDDL